MAKRRIDWRRWLLRKPSKVARYYLPTFDALEDRAMPALAGTLDGLFGVGGAAFAQFGANAAQAYGIFRDNVSNTGIYAAGLVNDGTSDRFALVRLNLDGSRDFTFGNQGMVVTPIQGGAIGPGPGDRANDVTGGITPGDGQFKIVVAGETWNGSNYDIAVVRYNADGSLDTTFGGDGKVVVNVPANNDDDQAYRVHFDSVTGKTTLVGSTKVGTRKDFVLVRLNENGSLDTGFGAAGTGIVEQAVGQDDTASGLAIDGAGNIYVGGTSMASSTGRDFVVLRYSSTGILSTTYGTGGIARINVGALASDDVATSLRLDSSNRVVIAGTVRAGANEDFGLVRLTIGGTLDSSFIGGGKTVVSFTANQDEKLNDIVIDAAGNIVAVGTTRDAGTSTGPASTLIARFNSNGGADNGFGSGGFTKTSFSSTQPDQSDDAQAIALDATGKILVAGHSFYNGSDVMDVQRFDATTTGTSALSASTHTYTVPANQTFDLVLSGQLGLISGGQLNNNLPITAVLFGSSATAQGTVTVSPNGSFRYTPNIGASGNDSFQYRLVDGLGGTSAPALVTLNFQANSAPVLTAGVPLPGILEDQSTIPGISIGTLLTTPPYSDADSGDARGVAITFVDTSHGQWQYQLTGTSTWVNFPPIYDPAGEAVHLFDTSFIRFVPNPDFNGTASFKYVGWDRTNVTASLTDGTLATISASGGSAAYSDVLAQRSGTINVAAVNDPPTFVVGPDQTVAEDSGANGVIEWAAPVTPGAPDEDDLVDFIITTSNDALFSVLPTINDAGDLSYTVAPNAFGFAIVTIRSHDDGGTLNGGQDTSSPVTFRIDVTPVNDVPSFEAGGDELVDEDSGPHTVTGWATNVSAGPNESGQTVTFTVDNDNIDLFSVQPAVASDGTLTYTLAANANGVANVTIYAKDNGGTPGVDQSPTQTFTITVDDVNDPADFDLVGDQTSAEDAGAQTVTNFATNISPGPDDEVAASQTVTFQVTNDNNLLFDVQPTIDASGTLTYTAAANASGIAIVTVTATDELPGGDSAPQTFTITISAVNDVPSFEAGGDELVSEDTGLHTVSGWATGISAGPANESGQTVTFTLSNDNIALFSVQPAVASNGTLTYTLAPNRSGVANVTIYAKDNGGTPGVDQSPTQEFTITVTDVNDPPTFSIGGNQTSREDAGTRTVANFATGVSPGPDDESSQTVSFTITTTNDALFDVGPAIDSDGTLTYTSAGNASGSAVVTVIAVDSLGATSAPRTFTINVTAVNDPPSFERGPGREELEDAPARSIANWASGISAGEPGQTVTFTVTNNNNALFAVQPAVSSNGTLTYRLRPDAFGFAQVTVIAVDNGGTANGGSNSSSPQTFTINVTAVNDAPSFVVGPNQTVLEDAGPQTISKFATSISAGPANESSQTVNFIVTNDNDSLFTVGPAISATGTLTYTLRPNANGVANVTVRLRDDGGDVGVNTSAARTFVITVVPVVDVLPDIDDVLPNVAEDSTPFTATPATLLANDRLDRTFGSSPNLLIVAAGSVLGGAVALANSGVTFTPTPDYNGPAQFFYIVRDQNAAPGQIDEYIANVEFQVTEVNDAPVVQDQTLSNYDAASGPRFIAWTDLLGNASAGPDNESAQQVIGTSAFNAVGGTVQAVVGGVIFTPDPGYDGTASFTYFVVDDGTTSSEADPKSATAVASFSVGPTQSELPPATTSPSSSTTSSTATPSNVAKFFELLSTDGDSITLANNYAQYSTSSTADDFDEFRRSIRAVLGPPSPAQRAVMLAAWGELDPRIAVVAQLLQNSPGSRLALPTARLSDTMSAIPATARRGPILQIVSSQFDGEDSVWIIEGILRGANAPATPATVRPANLPPAPPLAPATPEPPAPPQESSWLVPASRWAVGMAMFMGLVANVAFQPFADKEVFPTTPRRKRRK